MASKVLGKINGKIKFLYRKQSFLNSHLKRLLCNALIQPHFDFACLAWYTGLNKKLKKKLQTCQNKCIRFCLNMGNREHIGYNEFKKINWLPTKNRFEQCLLTSIYKYFNGLAPVYYEEMYCPMNQNHVTRSSYQKLVFSHSKSNRGQKILSYIGPRLWNSTPNAIKASNSTNLFKHALKDSLFSNIKKIEDSPYIFY